MSELLSLARLRKPGRRSAAATRPRILLTPDIAAWVLGEMANHIADRFGEEFDFYSAPHSLFWRRPDFIRALAPHLHLIHALDSSSLPLLLKLGVPELPPIVTWIHHVTQWSPENELAVTHSVALTVCTPGWKRTIEEMRHPPLPIQVVRHGVDLERFRPGVGSRSTFGLPQHAFLIGFLGARESDLDSGRKGVSTLIEVLKTAMPRIPNAHVVFAGPGWDGVVSELRALGLAGTALGFCRRSSIPQLFAALNVYLMTSRVEGGPCTVLESMACATPVVATRVGLVPDLVEDGCEGFTAEPDDVRTLAQGVLALAQDREGALRMGASARAKAEQHSWRRNLEPLGPFYRRHMRTAVSSEPPPGWMSDSGRVVRAARAADGIATALDQIRRQGISSALLKSAWNALDGLSFRDRLRGAAMLKASLYRT